MVSVSGSLRLKYGCVNLRSAGHVELVLDGAHFSRIYGEQYVGSSFCLTGTVYFQPLGMMKQVESELMGVLPRL